MHAFPVEVPELVRAYQKDQQYCAQISQSLSTICQGFVGTRQYLGWQRELSLLSDFLYYSCTTLSGLQTIGEEYLQLVEFVNRGGKRVSASWLRRFAFVFLQVFGGYLVDKLIWLAGRSIKNCPDHSPREHLLAEETVSFLRQNLVFVSKFHLALFYVSGTYHSLVKRIFGIQYLTLRPQTSGETLKLFRLLGLFALAESIFSLGLAVAQFRTKLTRRLRQVDSQPSAKEAGSKIIVAGRSHCCLCLESDRPTATTPCGHLFCWYCLVELTVQTPSCPICRQTVTPSSVVPLLNF